MGAAAGAPAAAVSSRPSVDNHAKAVGAAADSPAVVSVLALVRVLRRPGAAGIFFPRSAHLANEDLQTGVNQETNVAADLGSEGAHGRTGAASTFGAQAMIWYVPVCGMT
jgi:hypothetical protein